MHTFKANKASFTYNSDLSGDVIVNNGGKNIHISGQDLKDFFANFIRGERTAKLESMTTNQILGLRKK